MDLDPDIITLAKGIGGFGTPLAMNLNKPEHDKHWSPGEHTGTFRGQGISFVAGKVAGIDTSMTCSSRSCWAVSGTSSTRV
jgi:diaminobutyrate-2-oxoglutarate transaminase